MWVSFCPKLTQIIIFQFQNVLCSQKFMPQYLIFKTIKKKKKIFKIFALKLIQFLIINAPFLINAPTSYFCEKVAKFQHFTGLHQLCQVFIRKQLIGLLICNASGNMVYLNYLMSCWCQRSAVLWHPWRWRKGRFAVQCLLSCR